MAKYFDKSILEELDESRKRIFAERELIYKKHKIDVLDTDTLSSLSVYEVVSTYDSDYNINFARNGEDALSEGVKIEQKCSRVEKKKKTGIYAEAMFQFHAMGDLVYPRYIFVARDKETLELTKIYDISKKKNVKIVQDHLMGERQVWEDRCAVDKKHMKRDVIGIPEKVLKTLKNTDTIAVGNCSVVRG